VPHVKQDLNRRRGQYGLLVAVAEEKSGWAERTTIEHRVVRWLGQQSDDWGWRLAV